MNLLVLSIITLIAGASTGVGGVLGVLFRPGEKSLILGLGFSSGIMLGVTFLILVLESLEAGFFLSFGGFITGTLLFFLFSDYLGRFLSPSFQHCPSSCRFRHTAYYNR